MAKKITVKAPIEGVESAPVLVKESEKGIVKYGTLTKEGRIAAFQAVLKACVLADVYGDFGTMTKVYRGLYLKGEGASDTADRKAQSMLKAWLGEFMPQFTFDEAQDGFKKRKTPMPQAGTGALPFSERFKLASNNSIWEWKPKAEPKAKLDGYTRLKKYLTDKVQMKDLPTPIALVVTDLLEAIAAYDRRQSLEDMVNTVVSEEDINTLAANAAERAAKARKEKVAYENATKQVDFQPEIAA